MPVDITVPTIGESITEGILSRWLVANGEQAQEGEPLYELETDKVTTEVPADASGQVTHSVAEGDTVEVGATVGSIDTDVSSGRDAFDEADAEAEDEDDDEPVQKTERTPAATPSGNLGDSVDVVVPNVGESISEGILSRWLVENGETVQEGDPIFELETDKITTEVPAETTGTVAHKVAEGETVAVGATVGTIAPGSGPVAGAEQIDRDKNADSGSNKAGSGDAPKTGPAAAKLIRENDLDVSAIPATGKNGTVTKADVQKHLERQAEAPSKTPASSAPAPTTAQKPAPPAKGTAAHTKEPDGVERKRMSPLRQRIATRLVQAQHTAAILTTFNEVDMSRVMALRSKYKEDFKETHQTSLGFMSFFTCAAVKALQKFPLINARIDGTDILQPNYVNMGIAVGTPKGLVVPVLKDAQDMSFADIERTIREYAAKARDGKLQISDMEGGTFTITNGGVYGSMMSTPIINPPQSGILGMHAIQERPVARDGEVVIRPMMYTALSYDHRIVDGAEAVGFLVRLKELIEDPERLIFDL